MDLLPLGGGDPHQRHFRTEFQKTFVTVKGKTAMFTDSEDASLETHGLNMHVKGSSNSFLHVIARSGSSSSPLMGPVQAYKRAFVKVLLRIAAFYSFVCKVNRDSTDAELNSAFRKVAAKCHPDKGGNQQHSQELNAARDAWQNAQKQNSAPDAPGTPAVPEKGFRIHRVHCAAQPSRTWPEQLLHSAVHLRSLSARKSKNVR